MKPRITTITLGDGDLVAVHSHIVLRSGEQGVAAVHLFRFHGDKIMEMWDCGEFMIRTEL